MPMANPAERYHSKKISNIKRAALPCGPMCSVPRFTLDSIKDERDHRGNRMPPREQGIDHLYPLLIARHPCAKSHHLFEFCQITPHQPFDSAGDAAFVDSVPYVPARSASTRCDTDVINTLHPILKFALCRLAVSRAAGAISPLHEIPNFFRCCFQKFNI